MTSNSERGYAMAALLVALSVMSIMLATALPVWRTMVQREREAELVFRGEQYVQAIELFSRRTGGFPPSLNVLRDGRFIRKLYKDPITDGDFQPVYLGQVGVGGMPAVPGQQPPPQPGRGPALFGAPGQQQSSPGTGGSPLTGATSQLPSPTGRGLAPASPFGQASTPGAGPIIGVSSRSTAQSLRLYNGRNHYNEWLFVSTAATRDAGGGAGAPAPGMGVPGRGGRGGRGGQPLAPGRGAGTAPDGLNRGGPTRGFPTPPAPGRANPFGGPNTPAPAPIGGRGRS
ncbi:MAG TPA: type II secretion system protein [Vicinamibacterales bacterium]|jgi:type II secretory pathway pseudopilin PulG|nr:type II secretion system protein [Vicinamibacterales bacterium]